MSALLPVLPAHAALAALPVHAPPRGPVRAPGQGRLTIAVVAGASAVIEAHASAPLKLIAPRQRGVAAWVVGTTFGGGLLAGDRIGLSVDVDPGAALFLGTQSATKIFRSPDDRESAQDLSARIGADSLLVAWPDPVTCFAAARYRQTIALDLAATGSVVLVDMLTAGRASRGECWTFASCQLRTDVRRANHVILRDALRLVPDPAAPGALAARFGPRQALATVLLLGPRVAALAATLRARIAAQPAATSDVLVAASPIASDADGDGLILRCAATATEPLERFLRSALAPLAVQLGGDPWRHRS